MDTATKIEIAVVLIILGLVLIRFIALVILLCKYGEKPDSRRSIRRGIARRK